MSYAPRAIAPALGDDATDAASYLAWVASTKAIGGRVTAYPFHEDAPWVSWTDIFGAEDAWGLPAAQFPIERVYLASGAFRSPFTEAPRHVSNDGNTAYYLAPLNILAWAAGGGLKTIGGAGVVDQTPPDQKPQWYENLVNNLSTGGKYIAIGAAAVLGLAVLSYLPRRRD